MYVRCPKCGFGFEASVQQVTAPNFIAPALYAPSDGDKARAAALNSFILAIHFLPPVSSLVDNPVANKFEKWMQWDGIKLHNSINYCPDAAHVNDVYAAVYWIDNADIEKIKATIAGQAKFQLF